ncbi:PLP-dependent lyase/thiolase [bacterium]|nr:PLP-dependent lyase/thiolase [bacterium]
MALNEEEETILNSILVGSYNDPTKPEFPPHNPEFPASPTFQIEVPGFSNVWLKDESVHKYSNTHKDRLAWEVVILYRDFLSAKQRGVISGALPQFSMISSGSAALAVSRTLEAFGLPKLKVLIDKNLDEMIKDALSKAHCELFFENLSEKPLAPQEILDRTDNPNGFDLTSNQGISLEIGNYDWMGYEVLNQKADFVFVPFGTGIIFKKVMELNKIEVSSFGFHDPRYKGDSENLRSCSYIGATSTVPGTAADKLYAPFLPFPYINQDWIRFYKTAGYCGELTGIYPVEESFIHEGFNLAHSLGLNCEPSGSAGLAMLLQMQDKVPKD